MKKVILFTALLIFFMSAVWVVADLTSHTESTLDTLLLNLDADFDGAINDESWFTTGTVDTSGTPVANDFARFTDADTVAGRSYAEVRADLSLEDADIVTMLEALSALDLSSITTLSLPSVSLFTFKDTDTSPSAVGQFVYDNTVTGLTDGALAWYDDDAIRYIVDLATLPSDDDYVVAYDADADGFYMKADSTGSGSLGTNLSSTSNDITSDNNVIQLISNSEDLDIEFDTNSVDITTDTGVTEIDLIGIDLKDDGVAFLTAAANTIDSDQYVDGSIDTAHIAADQITSALIADDQIDSEHYVAASIDNEHLADDAVGTAEIATDAVTMDAVDADGNFTTLTGNWHTTGNLSGGVVTTSKSANYTVGTDSIQECYGGVVYVTSTCDITACDNLATGMSFSVITIGATQVDVDVQSDDLMYLDGTALDDGDKAVNTSTTGDMITCIYYGATGWYCISGSPDGDKWTDGS